jgi:hypothetical protein
MILDEYIKENRTKTIIATIRVASYIGVKTDWLSFLIWFESRWNHRIVNFQPGDDPDPAVRCLKRATGLIQFMPFSSISLGTNNQKLREMTNYEQMEYVRMYLSPFKGKCKNWLDLYCSIFWPAAVGKPENYRITPDIVAKQNPIFDINKDLDIEKSEIRTVLFKRIPDEYKELFI